MAVDEMSADAVSDKRLVRPFEITVESGVGYWLVVAEGRREPRKVKLFREWMRKEWPELGRWLRRPARAHAYQAAASRRPLDRRSRAGAMIAAKPEGGSRREDVQ